MLCGPDQIEDAKMSSIIRRILEAAIEHWEELRKACGVEASAFEQDLLPPGRHQDYEDPLVSGTASDTPMAERVEDPELQITGIILQDNEESTEERPPLPPRPAAQGALAPAYQASHSGVHEQLTLRRKPVSSSFETPPRYSTVITDAPYTDAESPMNIAATADGFAPRRLTDNSVTAKDQSDSEGI